MPVQMISMESSNLQSAGYDPKEHSLFVKFHTGRTYKYLHLPPLLWQGLQQSPSKGRFFAEQIRNVFEYEIVQDDVLAH